MANADTAKTAYIREVTDLRVFPKVKTQEGTKPWPLTDDEKARALGRKSVGLPGASQPAGGLILPEGQKVTDLVKASVAQALAANGYRVLDSEADVSSDTKVLSVDMNQFWLTTKPKWNLKITVDIGAQIQSEEGKRVLVETQYVRRTGVPGDSPFVKTINGALERFIEKAKAALAEF